MIRVVTLISPSLRRMSTKPTGTLVEVAFHSSPLIRSLAKPRGNRIKFYAGYPPTDLANSPETRVRILVGPESIGSELDDMNRFLVAKAVGSDEVDQVSPGTLEKYAADLKQYAEWLLEHWYPTNSSNHYLNFRSHHPLGRPTYAYRHFVEKLSSLSSSTKNNRMAAVRAFYEHLALRGVISEKDVERVQKLRTSYLTTSNGKGLVLRKGIKISDLSIPNSKGSAIPTLCGTVIDGGTVRPLSDIELRTVLDVLRELDNPVLRLSAYLALNSGARLQTVLTLRRFHAKCMLSYVRRKLAGVAIQVGGTHEVQAKGGREYLLQVPTRSESMVVPCQDLLGDRQSIGEMLGNFERSSFSITRYEKAKALRSRLRASLESDDDEYLFLGRGGTPYYLHSEDPLNLARKSPRRGEGFKSSMASTLAPRIRAAARREGLIALADAGLRFHDFRGTFAEQSLIAIIDSCKRSGMRRIQAEETALRETQRLLGHSSIESTYRYLHFRDEHARLLGANESYANTLLSHP